MYYQQETMKKLKQLFLFSYSFSRKELKTYASLRSPTIMGYLWKGKQEYKNKKILKKLCSREKKTKKTKKTKKKNKKNLDKLFSCTIG